MEISKTAENGLLDAVRDRLRSERKNRGFSRRQRRARKSDDSSAVPVVDDDWSYGYEDMSPEEKAIADEERAAIAKEKAEYEAEKAARRQSVADSLVAGDVFGGPLDGKKEK